MFKEKPSSAVIIPLVYVLIGFLWILLSDRMVLAIVKDHALALEIQTYKGWFYVAATGALLYWGINRSFSQLIQSRSAAVESEARFRAVYSSNMIGIFFWDVDGTIKKANNAYLQMLGYTEEDLRAGRLNWKSLTPTEFHEADQRGLAEIQAGLPCTPFEKEMIHREGVHVPIIIGGCRVGDLPESGVGFAIDISERKRAEEEVQRLNALLEEKVQERTKELQVANRELESFSYSVSHDLRAPLRSLSGFSHALMEDYGDKLDRDGKDYLDRIKKASERMSELLEDLLQFSRVQRSEIAREEFNLADVARRIAGELSSLEPNRQVEFEIQPEISVEGDPTLLRAALTNLMSNAWKFTSKIAEAKIKVSQEWDGTITVQDNGVGFEEEFAQKIFDPFERLHPTHEYPGSGIGLATVKRIIERHGGRVWARSELGQGARFFFLLP